MKVSKKWVEHHPPVKTEKWIYVKSVVSEINICWFTVDMTGMSVVNAVCINVCRPKIIIDLAFSMKRIQLNISGPVEKNWILQLTQLICRLMVAILGCNWFYWLRWKITIHTAGLLFLQVSQYTCIFLVYWAIIQLRYWNNRGINSIKAVLNLAQIVDYKWRFLITRRSCTCCVGYLLEASWGYEYYTNTTIIPGYWMYL